MSQLSAQSIRRLCQADPPLITPFVGEKTVVNGKSYGLSAASYDVRIAHKLTLLCGESALAHTVEDFWLPDNVVGYVVDKSTWARRHVTAFNTLIDAGFHGNLTLELVNLGHTPVDFNAGDPVCQICFHWLDEPTELPYSGKYAGQTKAAHGPRHENEDGSWRQL